MALSDRSHVVAPLAGAGWLWAGPAAVVFTPSQADPRSSEVGRLLGAGAGGWELVARLLTATADGSLSDAAPFGVGVPVPDGLVVVTQGVDAYTGPDGRLQPAVGGIAVVTAPPETAVRLGSGDWEGSHGSGDLVEGIARAGGVAFLALPGVSAASLATAGGGAPTASRAGELPASLPPPPPSVLGSAPEDASGPPSERLRGATGPKPVTVKGVSCGRGHFNDPAARFCRVCGLGMRQGERSETEGARPPLGSLVWDHGGSDEIEADVVIGREPQHDPRVAAGEAEGLVPSEEVASLSRIHAEITLDGWVARLTDRGSSNGTFVWDPDMNQWRRLDAGVPIVLEAGMRLGFAERMAVFETGTPSE